MFKLISGEIVIADANPSATDNTKTNLQSPLCVSFESVSQSTDGKIGIAMYPLNPFEEVRRTCITINNCNILFEIENPPASIIESYINKTSGITIVKKPMPSIKFPS